MKCKLNRTKTFASPFEGGQRGRVLMIKIKFTLLLIFAISFNSNACECICTGDCSFKAVSQRSDFVALVKITSYDDYFEMDKNLKSPGSMIVEIIEVYKGIEQRKQIKIWGDDGNKCRPYCSTFKLNEYYLISPSILSNKENNKEFEFFSCSTDYLKVDMTSKMITGNYTDKINNYSLLDFENDIKNK